MELAFAIVLLLTLNLWLIIAGWFLCMAYTLRHIRLVIMSKTRKLLDKDLSLENRVEIETRVEVVGEIMEFFKPPFYRD